MYVEQRFQETKLFYRSLNSTPESSLGGKGRFSKASPYKFRKAETKLREAKIPPLSRQKKIDKRDSR